MNKSNGFVALAGSLVDQLDMQCLKQLTAIAVSLIVAVRSFLAGRCHTCLV
ncbi:hypothetical protein [Rhodopirellula islandica]|uniref:hypothetical protein n=1 Tax=Rhodopirellula islandica TaxID=595434 RepID=UPI0013648E31|nr:hypothetical protein [Rhodopirellula islandica]